MSRGIRFPHRALAGLLVAAGFLTPLRAEETPKPASSAEASKEAPRSPTADELWKRLEELRQPSTAQAQSREEYAALLKSWFGAQQTVAEEFLQKYPDDPRRHGARIVAIQAGTQVAGISGVKISAAAAAGHRQQLEAILSAPDASEEIKGEAGFVRVNLLANAIDPMNAASVTAFLQAGDQFLAAHPDHRLALQMKQTIIDVVSGIETPETEAALARFAAGKDESLAVAAGQVLAMRQRNRDLRSKPVALKFTATDGTAVDLEKLRGKVVLVDFWASWCAPCLIELPTVVAAYRKLRERGFEVIGVSLDQEKEAMEEAVKTLGMTWPQHFDGGGFQNQISSGFGITGIPDAWLIDKRGMLRATRVSGEILERGVEKLLAE